MTLTFDDKKSVKNIVRDELDQKLGFRLEKVKVLVGKTIDERLGPKLEKVDELINKNLDQRLGPHLENVEKLVKQVISEDETLVRKEDVKHLPTKEEFFEREDKIMGELKVVREEITMLSDLNRKVNDHEERIEKVEFKLGIHPAI